jgi:hypothetical protein
MNRFLGRSEACSEPGLVTGKDRRREHQPVSLHRSQQIVRRKFGPLKAHAHARDSRKSGLMIVREVEGIGDEFVSRSHFESDRPHQLRRKVPEIVGHDLVRPDAERSGDHMGVILVRNASQRGREAFPSRDHRLRKRSLNGKAGGACAHLRFRTAALMEEFANRDFCFIKDPSRPRDTEEVRLRQGQEQVALQDRDQNAGIEDNREAVCEHVTGSDQVGVRLHQLGRSRPISPRLVCEEVLGLNSAVTVELRELYFTPLEQRDQERPRYVQNVSRLLGGEHLTYRNQRDGLATANVTKKVKQQVGQLRGQQDFGRLRSISPGQWNSGTGPGPEIGKHATQLLCRQLVGLARQVLAEFPRDVAVDGHVRLPACLRKIAPNDTRDKRIEKNETRCDQDERCLPTAPTGLRSVAGGLIHSPTITETE